MKSLVFALAVAILIAGQVLTPAAAAAAPAALAYEDCGETYVVQYQDYLAKIARTCGTSVATILSLNPTIVNANLIYAGQVLRLTGSAPITTWPIYYYPYITSSGSARVSVSTTRAVAGDAVTVYVSGFPANSEIDYRVGQQGSGASVIYDGTVGSDGATSQTITLPSDADIGEYWAVQVVTTSLASAVSVTSHTIYINTYSPYIINYGYARVSLSATTAGEGDTVTVSVSGFPANAEIDYRVGQQGSAYSVVYDGTVASNGSTSQVITLPSDADTGEYWTVQVITTSMASIVSVTSHTIYINH